MADQIEETPVAREVPATNQGLSDFLKEKVEGYNVTPNTDEGTVNDKLLGTDETETETEKARKLSDSNNESDNKEKEGVNENEETEVEGKEGETDDNKDGETDEKDEKSKDKGEGEEDDDKGEKGEGETDKQEVEPEPGKPVPYDRFKQVVDERTKVETEYSRQKPKIENFERIQRFCAENSITPDQFEKAMRVQALLNTDPAKALAEIMPIVEQLQGFTGGKLPKDLQAAVDEGKISQEYAREMATLRAQTQFKEASAKRNAELSQRRAQEEMNRQMGESAASWEEKKRLADPDYRPKKSESAPDGLYEDVQDKFQALVTKTDPTTGNFINPVRTTADLVALLDRAYEAVKGKWTKNLTPKKPATGKKLPSNGANNSKGGLTEENAPTMADAIKARLASRR